MKNYVLPAIIVIYLSGLIWAYGHNYNHSTDDFAKPLSSAIWSIMWPLYASIIIQKDEK